MIDYDECLKKRLLRKIAPSKEKANASLEKAKEFLKEADDNLKEGRYNTSLIIGYLAIFNAARSILFKDGFRERSHACTIRYLEKKYAKQIPKRIISMIDRYRTQRHQTQYDIGYHPTKQDAGNMIELAEETITQVEKIIKQHL